MFVVRWFVVRGFLVRGSFQCFIKKSNMVLRALLHKKNGQHFFKSQ